jgi:hypothetical protein
MVIDNDSRAIVIRSVNEILETWSSNAQLEDLAILNHAIGEAQKKLALSIKRGRMDEVTGIAVRIEVMADKLASFAKHVARA